MARFRGRAPHFLLRHRLLFGVLGACAILLLGIVVGIAVLLSGVLSTAATEQHSAFTYWLLDTGLRYSLRESADDIEAPALTDVAMIERGRACFRVHCVHCHGAPGLARESHGLGMMPIPNDLTEAARDWPPEWLYYVTAKGVRMTGMPAWEFRLSDADLWATVAFLRQFPRLSRAEYRRLAPLPPETSCRSEAAGTARRASQYDTKERGEVVLRQYACHACHRIEGVVGPDAPVGPPLADWPARRFIAGTLPNTPDNLVRWIMKPDAVSPGTLMPDLGVTEAHAREMAGFLFSQKAQAGSVLRAIAPGDSRRGRAALVAHECGACHRIPGIPAARGTVGPSLEDFRERLYIAGREPNTTDNLVAWIRDAPSIDPDTAMPDLDVDEADARDMAAYLYR